MDNNNKERRDEMACVPGKLLARGEDTWYTTPEDKIKWRRYIRCFVRDYGSYYGPYRAGVDYSREFGRIKGLVGFYACETHSRIIFFRFRKVRGRQETRVWWWVVAPSSDPNEFANLEA